MIHTTDEFSARVEQAVAAIEARTDAEVVVIAANASDSYRDVLYLWASGISAVALAVLIFVPWTVSPLFALVDVVGVWLLCRWALDSPWFLRRVLPKQRRERQVRLAAEAEFTREAVHATPRREAVLIYVSALEGRVEILPDLGLEARIARGRWSEAAAQFAHDDVEHFVAGLNAIGDLLEAAVPHTGDAGRVDMPNAPRIRG